MMLLSIMMQGDTVEFLKRIHQFATWRSKSRVERDAFHPAGAHINACALLDIAEVDRVDGAALVWDHGWLHMPEESPLRGAEERVRFDVRSACAGAESTHFVFDEQFSDKRLAETRLLSNLVCLGNS